MTVTQEEGTMENPSIPAIDASQVRWIGAASYFDGAAGRWATEHTGTVQQGMVTATVNVVVTWPTQGMAMAAAELTPVELEDHDSLEPPEWWPHFIEDYR